MTLLGLEWGCPIISIFKYVTSLISFSDLTLLVEDLFITMGLDRRTLNLDLKNDFQ